jgi:hypothetical protein
MDFRVHGIETSGFCKYLGNSSAAETCGFWRRTRLRGVSEEIQQKHQQNIQRVLRSYYNSGLLSFWTLSMGCPGRVQRIGRKACLTHPIKQLNMEWSAIWIPRHQGYQQLVKVSRMRRTSHGVSVWFSYGVLLRSLHGAGRLSRCSDYATDWMIGVRVPVEERDVPFSVDSRPTLGPTKYPIRWVARALPRQWGGKGWRWQQS